MDSFLLISPYSFLLSILLMLGNFSIGHFFLKNNFLKDIFNDISNSIFQKAFKAFVMITNNVFNIDSTI